MFLHLSTSLNSMAILEQRKKMTEHVRIVPRWEEGLPTLVQPNVNVPPARSGDLGKPFFCGAYVQYIGLVRAQHRDDDHSALQVSPFLAADCLRVFGPGIPHETPILAPTKSSH